MVYRSGGGFFGEIGYDQRIFHFVQITAFVCYNHYYCFDCFKGPAKTPLILYASQLVLNWAWSPLFFEFHQLKWVRTIHIYIFYNFAIK